MKKLILIVLLLVSSLSYSQSLFEVKTQTSNTWTFECNRQFSEVGGSTNGMVSGDSLYFYNIINIGGDLDTVRTPLLRLDSNTTVYNLILAGTTPVEFVFLDPFLDKLYVRGYGVDAATKIAIWKRK